MAKRTERDLSTNEKFQHIPRSLKTDKLEKKSCSEIHRNWIEQRIRITTILRTMITMAIMTASTCWVGSCAKPRSKPLAHISHPVSTAALKQQWAAISICPWGAGVTERRHHLSEVTGLGAQGVWFQSHATAHILYHISHIMPPKGNNLSYSEPKRSSGPKDGRDYGWVWKGNRK